MSPGDHWPRNIGAANECFRFVAASQTVQTVVTSLPVPASSGPRPSEMDVPSRRGGTTTRLPDRSASATSALSTSMAPHRQPMIHRCSSRRVNEWSMRDFGWSPRRLYHTSPPLPSASASTARAVSSRGSYYQNVLPETIVGSRPPPPDDERTGLRTSSSDAQARSSVRPWVWWGCVARRRRAVRSVVAGRSLSLLGVQNGARWPVLGENAATPRFVSTRAR